MNAMSAIIAARDLVRPLPWEKSEEGGRDHVIATTDIPRSKSTDT